MTRRMGYYRSVNSHGDTFLLQDFNKQEAVDSANRIYTGWFDLRRTDRINMAEAEHLASTLDIEHGGGLKPDLDGSSPAGRTGPAPGSVL
jgi:hypothetical protein